MTVYGLFLTLDNNSTNVASLIIDPAEIFTKPSIDTVHAELVQGRQSSSQPHNISRYPSWETNEAPAPVSVAEIQSIFDDFAKAFGFQTDNVRNMMDHLLTMLDSRASRMSPRKALWTLHADYIGGEHANYRKWYFAAQLDLDEWQSSPQTPTGMLLDVAKTEWRDRMQALSDRTRVAQIALYLLIWGEAATLRYMPELLCFIFKLADDYRDHLDTAETSSSPPSRHSGYFLDHVITPLYRFVRDQSYQVVRGEYVRKEKDHNDIIGYDDMNQLFWCRGAMRELRLRDGKTLLMDIPREKQYECLPEIDWAHAFHKMYYETRSWLHLLSNFSRIWVIHAVTFWYYMAANLDFLYMTDGVRELPVKLSIIGLGGLVAVLIMMAATVAERKFLSSAVLSVKILLARLFWLLLAATAHIAAWIYVFWMDRTSTIALIVGACQLGCGAILAILLVCTPAASVFQTRSSCYLHCRTFICNFPSMSSDDRSLSVLLWVCVFTCKFLETYFFLALPFRDALAATSTMRLLEYCGTTLAGHSLCILMPKLTSVLMFLVEFVLFFLDTYLWYVVWNTMFSVSQAFRMGISFMTSWKTLFARIPHQLYNKVLATTELTNSRLRKLACSQMWNAIVISMYREHLLSNHNLQMLLYHWRPGSNNDNDNKEEEGEEQPEQEANVGAPAFFDPSTKTDECFPPYSEAERRFSFFAQSLSTDMPAPCPVSQMPTFTVFTPHYAEKMILTLREIIREEDSTTRVTLLEYLKRLHPHEWDNFVRDTKFMVEEETFDNVLRQRQQNQRQQPSSSTGNSASGEKDDLPFYCIGFKSSKPVYTMRTRIWASLRAQTLYRTVSGFMNYARALKILHLVEYPDETAEAVATTGLSMEAYLDAIAHRKFRYLVAMQRYSKFTPEEAENCEAILQEYPNLQIAYIEEEENNEGAEEGEYGEKTYYSVLIDGHCPKLPGNKNKRQPRYRIRLPGNPILGDGKSDNQNHAIIFYRGEYLQLVDANQDNYLEECLKVRSIFREFESSSSSEPPKDHDDSLDEVYALQNDPRQVQAPVAIVGAREYIFSENVGVLGDVAAGKEQTFGTLTQRVMAKMGGRLHYGHPDFLNAVFMTTRGGVSKAQRGLHLNEDIYAGMNAMSRGGRIKHTEYLQCGKGRDLGFCSILNFTTKIGTGMGEQMLSREYYYLGTQLPIDRFLTFYYAHPGFHLNNIMIIFAVQLFLFCMTLAGTFVTVLPDCHGSLSPDCVNMTPMYDWLKRCITSIFWVFFIAYLPLFLQELTEKGTWRSTLRFIKQFLSLSPVFEVFVNQIYANSVLSNLSFGGARYIATGRGFATSRIPFSVLYARFANSSIYFGARTMIMLLFVTMTLWIPHLLYFWATVASLVIAPFLFNPHQFALCDFIIDYREFLGWLTRGNGGRHCKHAWITFCRESRIQITGTKRKKKRASMMVPVAPRARLSSIFASEILMPLLQAALCLACYLFYQAKKQQQSSLLSVVDPDDSTRATAFFMKEGLLRVASLTQAPIMWNAVVLLVLLPVSIALAALGRSARIGLYMAGIAHGLALLGLIVSFEFFWWLEDFAVQPTILGMLTMFAFQRFIFKAFVALVIPRELHHDSANQTWWTGRWRESQVRLIELYTG